MLCPRLAPPLLATALALLVVADPADARGRRKPAKPFQRIYLELSGVSGKGATARVAKALRAVEGVTYATVLPDGREATVTRKSGSGPDADLEKAVRTAGFSARVLRMETVQLTVYGLDCTGCVERVHRVVGEVKGTRRVRVTVAKRQVTVTFESRKTTAAKIIGALKKAGFFVRRAR